MAHQKKALSSVIKCHKSVISNGKAYLLGSKWTQEKVDKTCNGTINKTYAACKQRELNQKGKKTRKALGKHVINLCSTGICWVVKVRDVKKLQQDIIENDPIIKDQMRNLGYLLVCTFGNFLAPFLVAVYTMSNLYLGGEPEDEGHRGD